MRITKHGIIYSGEHEPMLSSCAFPGICQLHDGTMMASFKGAETKGPYNKTDRAMFCISTDNGENWSEPRAFFEPPVVDGKPTTIRTGYFVEVTPGHVMAVINAVDATMEDLPYYNEETEGLKDTYIMVAHSLDGGANWSDLERIQVSTFYDMPLPLTGAPFVTKEGRVGIQFEVNKPYYETAYWVHHSCAVFSDDGGYTWGDEVVITDCPTVYYWDQRLDTLADGTVTDIFWTFDRDKGDYVNIHYCESQDGGRTFGDLIDTGLVGQPGNVIDGFNGEILAVYINRDSVPEIRLAQSLDHGKTWADVMTVYTYGKDTKGKKNAGMNDVWSEMAAFSIGHPYMERMQDGSIWVYFYSGPSIHRTDFHFIKIEQ
ncbi:MAG: exo-alpha-sialidase [Ruminococcaceae bacterium]|nr:exo-alpha-sialidase [Oscillospiraceae bacterium]